MCVILHKNMVTSPFIRFTYIFVAASLLLLFYLIVSDVSIRTAMDECAYMGLHDDEYLSIYLHHCAAAAAFSRSNEEF